jgi:hypothetical protein
MTDEARELHRIIRASVRDMLDACRLQAQAGLVFRGAQPVVGRLAPHPAAQRVALLPSVVRLMLPSSLEDVAGADGTEEGKGAR